MSLHRWATSKANSKKLQHVLQKIHEGVASIANDPETVLSSVCDFPEIKKYLDHRFPNVDVSHVIIYLAEPEVVNKVEWTVNGKKAGWKDAGGLYISSLKTIVVKKEIHTIKPEGHFAEVMHNMCKMKTDVEDVVIHELIHAVSHKLGRSSKQFSHMEEEFVYTNCVDFYKEKGMSEDDIVNNNFLPFFMHDVQTSRKDMIEVLAFVGSSISDVSGLSEEEYEAFCDEHAEVMVVHIKSKAQARGHHMMDLYHKYGVTSYQTEPIDHTENTTSLRFSSLDLEDF